MHSKVIWLIKVVVVVERRIEVARHVKWAARIKNNFTLLGGR